LVAKHSVQALNAHAGTTVAIYRDATIFVVDWQDNRIAKFRIAGPFPAPVEASPAP
jgi:hypothetical protein